MYTYFIKRLIDIISSIFLLGLLFPILLLIACVILIDIKEIPLFFQKRPGKNERIFTIIKFKTMKTQSEENEELLSDGRRISCSGRFLRKYSLDELSELWNILKGEMSFVGPRPLLIRYLPYYSPTEKKRHNVRPGMTGLAQVSGRNFLNWDKRLDLDAEYVENISFSLDVKIIIKTFFQLFHASGVSVNPDDAEGYLDEERAESFRPDYTD